MAEPTIWEGYVMEVGEHTFLARLLPLSDNAAEQEAWFCFDAVPEEQQSRIRTGAWFWWDGETVQFRRPPVWTQQEMDDIKTATANMSILFE